MGCWRLASSGRQLRSALLMAPRANSWSPQPAQQHRQLTCSASGAGNASREYPPEPRVGVAVVVFRRPVTQPGQAPEVLLIRRAKEPALGRWCFPGGSLELGETLAQCAAREVLEETGLRIRNEAGAPRGRRLDAPTPFAATDALHQDGAGRLRFHYVVVEVAAVAADPSAEPAAAGDVDGAAWVEVPAVHLVPNVLPDCAQLAQEACERFGVSG